MSASPPTRPAPAVPAPPPQKPSRRAIWIGVAGGVAALALGVWLVATKLPGWLTKTPGTSSGSTTSAGPSEGRKIHAQLFYVSLDGSELIPVSREVAYGSTPAEQLRRIVEAQIQPPGEGFVSAIPPGTTLRRAFIDARGEAYLDFGPEIVTNHTGGSLDEALAVFAIVNAVTVNLVGDVTAVQILVNGREVDTLVGHLDLRRPLSGSLAWIRKGR
jgi:spore germination protein GerM